MKKRFNLLLALLLSLSLISCSNSSPTSPTSHSPNTETIVKLTSNYIINTESTGNIPKIVTDLCSNQYKSRVVGTIQNKNATDYIQSFFKDNDIAPFINNEYTCIIDNGMDVINPFTTTNSTIDTLHNVAAVIKGTKSDTAVFVTAHFDHVDGLEGAIDNASGVSVMLETAHKIREATLDAPLDYDIVFVAFNAEETGLDGSLDFIKKYDNVYNNLYNINIDCVGYNQSTGLAMGCDHKPSSNLYSALIHTFDAENIDYTDEFYASKNGRVYGTSDHQVFRFANFASLTLGDSNIIDVVHTSNDTIDAVDFNALETLTTTISKFIVNNNGTIF